jgi:hypothetical protein
VKDRWVGQTAICVASGPSLAPEDCALAKASGHKIIAVNNSWRAIDCDVLYASDYAWWKRYVPELTSQGERWSNNKKAVVDFGCHHFAAAIGCNSGLAAIHLAMHFGAARILLLGYDCSPTGGTLHWHGHHVRCNNPNAISFRMWQKQFRQTHRHVRDRVINCSRETALTVFKRDTLENQLAHVVGVQPIPHQAIAM